MPLLAVSLALVSYFLGGYFVKVAIYTGIAKIVTLLAVCWVIYWLYRRISRGRRARVPRIPHL